jgi:hypothetical protein
MINHTIRIGAVMIFWAAVTSHGYPVRVSPLLPTVSDSVYLLVDIGFSDLTSDTQAVVGNSVQARVAATRNNTAPKTTVSVSIGKLPAGSFSYSVNIVIGDSSIHPGKFTVYPQTASPHRLVRFPDTVGSPTHSTSAWVEVSLTSSNDTLFVNTKFLSIYCPQFMCGMYSMGDAPGDTVTLMFVDTSNIYCEFPQNVTVRTAIAPVHSPRLYLRMLSIWHALDSVLVFDRTVPAARRQNIADRLNDWKIEPKKIGRFDIRGRALSATEKRATGIVVRIRNDGAGATMEMDFDR